MKGGLPNISEEEEARRVAEFPGIYFNGMNPRVARLRDACFDVWEVIAALEDFGGNTQDVIDWHKSDLTPAVLATARAYQARYPEEITWLIERGGTGHRRLDDTLHDRKHGGRGEVEAT